GRSTSTLAWITAIVALALAVPAGPAAAAGSRDLAFAVSLARKGLWREATFRFRELVRKDPNNPRLWNNLAVAYEASGQYEKAREAYERARGAPAADAEILASNRSDFEAFYATWSAGHPAGGETEPPADEDGEDGG
ncbi:MAG: tetratricopeptide repeat protein, partial [Acidobacteriota bacterium]